MAPQAGFLHLPSQRPAECALTSSDFRQIESRIGKGILPEEPGMTSHPRIINLNLPQSPA